MTLYSIASGVDTSFSSHLNTNFAYVQNQLSRRVISNALHGSYVDIPQLYSNMITASTTHTSAINWSWDSTGQQYTNTQTSAATLSFENLLSGKRKNAISAISEACAWVQFDDAGTLESSIVGNASFETAGSGGADVFASWTETTVNPTAGSVTLAQDTTPSVTDGSKCMRVSGSATSQSAQYAQAQVSQSVDVTGYKYIGVDYYLDEAQTAGTQLAQTLLFTLTVGGLSTTTGAVSGSVGSTINATGTLVLDVSSLTGSQTMILNISHGGTGWTSRTYSFNASLDNIRCIKDGDVSGNLSRAIYLTADGSTWEAVTNGQWHKFTATGKTLGLKIVETRSDGSALYKDIVKEFGILYEG